MRMSPLRLLSLALLATTQFFTQPVTATASISFWQGGILRHFDAWYSPKDGDYDSSDDVSVLQMQILGDDPLLCPSHDTEPMLYDTDGTPIALILIASGGKCPLEDRIGLAEKYQQSGVSTIILSVDEEELKNYTRTRFDTMLHILLVTNDTAASLLSTIRMQSDTAMRNGGPFAIVAVGPGSHFPSPLPSSRSPSPHHPTTLSPSPSTKIFQAFPSRHYGNSQPTSSSEESASPPGIAILLLIAVAACVALFNCCCNLIEEERNRWRGQNRRRDEPARSINFFPTARSQPSIVASLHSPTPEPQSQVPTTTFEFEQATDSFITRFQSLALPLTQEASRHFLGGGQSRTPPTKLTLRDINLLVEADLERQDDGEQELSERPCPICIESCRDVANTPSQGSFILNLPCRHKFHLDCILPWLTQNKARCPLCNDDVGKRVVALQR